VCRVGEEIIRVATFHDRALFHRRNAQADGRNRKKKIVCELPPPTCQSVPVTVPSVRGSEIGDSPDIGWNAAVAIGDKGSCDT
jgi:hypothetical protein